MKLSYTIKKILRKIYHFIGFISLFVFFLSPVKADTILLHTSAGQPSSFCTIGGCNSTFSQAYSDIMSRYNDLYKEDYPYYILGYDHVSQNSATTFKLLMLEEPSYTMISGQYGFTFEPLNNASYSYAYFTYSEFQNQWTSPSSASGTSFIQVIFTSNNFWNLIDTNIDLKNTITDYEIEGFYQDNITLFLNSSIPTYMNLKNYASWQEYITDNDPRWTTVNLDDYLYVLLTLKNYNQSEPFQTNFAIKGQIGITPIYNFGQTSKDQITGVRVQDRCNLSYSDYTLSPMYVTNSDLQNNVVFAVKECSSNSSFKFANNIFNITYVTNENASDPTVTIDGVTYHTIPYTSLPSTATKNEVENYIPGATGGADGTGGLAGAIKDSQRQLANIWDVFTYFTDFVNQIFNALPPTLSNLLISAFVIALVLGLIKIFIH